MKSRKIFYGLLLISIGLAFIFLFESDSEITEYQSGKNVGFNLIMQLVLEYVSKNVIGVIVCCIGLIIIVKHLIKNRVWRHGNH